MAAIELKIVVAQATAATRLLSLIKTLTKYIATSVVIFFLSATRTRRRFPAKASSTSTVIHVTTVVLTATTIITAAIAKAATTTSGNMDTEKKVNKPAVVLVRSVYDKRTQTEIKKVNKHVVVVLPVFDLLKFIYQDMNGELEEEEKEKQSKVM